jgi:hypothetical protein
VLGAYGCYLFGARERMRMGWDNRRAPNSERGAPLEIPIPLHYDLKTARGLLLGRTSENSVMAKFVEPRASAYLGKQDPRCFGASEAGNKPIAPSGKGVTRKPWRW